MNKEAPKFSDRVKSWLGVLVALLMIGLFIGAYFSGKQSETGKAPAGVEIPSAEQPEANTVHKYQQPAEQALGPQEVVPDKDEAAAEIQDFAPSFLKLYVPFDSGITGEESTAQLSKMKPFVTDKLYQQLSEIKRRGTLTITKTEVMDIALLPAEIGEKVQYWNATIDVRFTDHNGKKETSVLPYILKVSYIDGKWKVDDVGVRTGAWNP